MPDITNALLRAFTGRNRQQLQDDVSLGKADSTGFRLDPTGSNLDKGVHALSAYNIANRFGPQGAGPVVADLMGSAKEVGDFFTGGEADIDDLRANAMGVRAAELEAQAADRTPAVVREGFGLEGARIQPARETVTDKLKRLLANTFSGAK